ncbi:uncharacterized protein LOC131583708 [Poecile atricapillus]|uniref:uncharacterized protein LOC131583708 n=1 Tax=Poecile atricapillus TaxID=48891 RepID=UPI0027395866|nr:uncharacterized protein LOC131583708 [Poecile atricapillus]
MTNFKTEREACDQTRFSLLKVCFSQSQISAALSSPWLLPSGSMRRGPWVLRDGDVGARPRDSPRSCIPIPASPSRLPSTVSAPDTLRSVPCPVLTDTDFLRKKSEDLRLSVFLFITYLRPYWQCPTEVGRSGECRVPALQWLGPAPRHCTGALLSRRAAAGARRRRPWAERGAELTGGTRGEQPTSAGAGPGQGRAGGAGSGGVVCQEELGKSRSLPPIRGYRPRGGPGRGVLPGPARPPSVRGSRRARRSKAGPRLHRRTPQPFYASRQARGTGSLRSMSCALTGLVIPYLVTVKLGIMQTKRKERNRDDKEEKALLPWSEVAVSARVLWWLWDASKSGELERQSPPSPRHGRVRARPAGAPFPALPKAGTQC